MNAGQGLPINIAKAMEAHIQQAETNTLPTPDADKADRFSPISLGDWLALCQKTGVPHVPAEKIATLLREDSLSFDTEGEHQERLRQAFTFIQNAYKPFHMARFDCCASLDIKANMASRRPAWLPEFGNIILDDPRAFDIILEYPREELPIWQRPWVSPILCDRYPVEYRAFVRDGALLGISSYYPQRPLPEFPDHLETVRTYTGRLIDAAPTPFLWPITFIPPDLNKDRVHFTADFMATPDGILFLEGGPPHEMGAHPCCFQPNRISGVALVNRNKEHIA